MLLELFFISLSVLLCVPTAQWLIDLMEDHLGIGNIFDIYGGGYILSWVRDEETGGPTTLGVSYLLVTLLMYSIDPMFHNVYTACTTIGLAWSSHRVNTKLQKLSDVLKNGSTKCHKHPDITLAICLELDGSIVEICYKCNPELAMEYGLRKGDDE